MQSLELSGSIRSIFGLRAGLALLKHVDIPFPIPLKDRTDGAKVNKAAQKTEARKEGLAL
jgi:hypothetical protein